MSRKTSAARREAFFRALAENGNQTVAAERARVSRSWVTLHRASDPAFRARIAAAVAGARERLRARADGVAPPGGWDRWTARNWRCAAPTGAAPRSRGRG